jgi:hypothetical protein
MERSWPIVSVLSRYVCRLRKTTKSIIRNLPANRPRRLVLRFDQVIYREFKWLGTVIIAHNSRHNACQLSKLVELESVIALHPSGAGDADSRLKKAAVSLVRSAHKCCHNTKATAVFEQATAQCQLNVTQLPHHTWRV